MLTQLKKVFIKIPIYYFIILIIAIVLRFWHVDNHGLFMYDDARLMHFTQTIVLFFKTGTVPVQPEFFSSAKPGSIFPFVLTALIFSQPTDLLFSQFTAFFSVCVVVMTMVVTKALFKSNLSALCAGLISALSPLQLYFSKFNVGGSLAMLFTLIGLYLYIRYFEKNSLKNLIFLGFVLGYGFTINYSILPFLLLIAILAIVHILRNQPKVHLFLFSASCLFFPIVFQVGYELLQLSDNRFPTYFTMLGNHREAILSDRQIYLDPLYYFDLFIKYDAASFILAMLGISLIYKKIKSTGNNIAIIYANIALLLLLSLSVSTAFLVSVPRTAYMLVAILPILGSLAITWALDVIGPIFLRCCKVVRILLGTGVFILGGGDIIWRSTVYY